jgi:hypothetical protein
MLIMIIDLFGSWPPERLSAKLWASWENTLLEGGEVEGQVVLSFIVMISKPLACTITLV